jgi:hypothetical protein
MRIWIQEGKKAKTTLKLEESEKILCFEVLDDSGCSDLRAEGISCTPPSVHNGCLCVQNTYSVTSGPAWCLAADGDGSRIAVGTEEGFVSIFSVLTDSLEFLKVQGHIEPGEQRRDSSASSLSSQTPSSSSRYRVT